MADVKAIRTGNVMRDEYFNLVEYEYRGCKYEVKFANDWSCCVTPAYIQHRDAQADIDDMLDNPKPEAKSNPIDWDVVWNMLEEG